MHQLARHYVALGNLIFKLLNCERIKIGMRIGVVSQRQALVYPLSQQRDTLLTLSGLTAAVG